MLTTAQLLYRLHADGQIMFGGDITVKGQKQNIREVDIFFIADETLAIAECKDIFSFSDTKLEDLDAAFGNTVDAAKLVSAQVIFLSVNSTEPIEVFSDVVGNASKKARGFGIGLHLIYNGDLYRWGNIDSDPEDLFFAHLQALREPKNQKRLTPAAVGQLPNQYKTGFGSIRLEDSN